MKMNILKHVGAVAAIGGMAALTAQAIPISGSVNMSGTVVLNTMSLATATSATSFSGVSVGTGGAATGAYNGTQGDSVSWNPFSWATTVGGVTAGPAGNLWSYTDATTHFTYTFQLASDTVVSDTASFLNLLGTGTLAITGSGSPYSSTAGNWSFTISNPGGANHPNFTFTFANSQTSVPDGTSTAMLLGTALSAVALIRRKLG